MIVDVHIHHVPEPFVRFVEKAAPYAIHLDSPRGESVTLHVGHIALRSQPHIFDADRLIARMREMRVEQAVLSIGDAVRQLRCAGEPRCEAADSTTTKSRPCTRPLQTASRAGHSCRCRTRGRRERTAPLRDDARSSRGLSPIERQRALSGSPGVLADIRGGDRPRRAALVHPSNPPARERMAESRACGRCRLSVRHHAECLSHDIRRAVRQLSEASALLHPSRRLCAVAARTHAAGARHKSAAGRPPAKDR